MHTLRHLLLPLAALLLFQATPLRAQNTLQSKPTASAPASDDFLYLGGATNSVRKLSPNYYIAAANNGSDFPSPATFRTNLGTAARAQTLKVAGVGLDGGGAAIPTATSTDTRIEQAATLTSLTLYLPYGVTGSVTVSIQKNGTTISGSTPVVLTSANYVTVTDFTGFTTATFAAGDRFGATTTGTPTATHFQLTAAANVTLN